ncbi:MAG: Subtilisin [Planctomycetaceae bacterium]|nr:Subtilisin [Planctomycetaceae bacterium]
MSINRLMQKLFNQPRTARRTPQRRLAALEDLEPRIVLTADGNDTMATAINAGAYSSSLATTTKTGSVGSTSDAIDYYKFTLSGSNLVYVNLTGLSQDLDLQLQDSTGHAIGSSTNNGSSSELVSSLLQSGTYYVKIYKGVSSAVSNYSLNLNFGDDSFSSAFNFGSFGTGTASATTINSSVGGTDISDYFKFTLTGNNYVKVALTGLSADVDVEILNSSGNRMTAGTNSGSTSESPSAVLNAGTYYVRVFKGLSSSSSNYRLQLTFGDDSRTEAVNIGTVSSGANISFAGNISGSDTSDYYKFVVTSTKSGQVNLTGLSADLDFEILNSSGTRIGSVANKSGTQSESLNFSNFAAGTYYIRVFKGVSSASSNYTVNLKVT